MNIDRKNQNWLFLLPDDKIMGLKDFWARTCPFDGNYLDDSSPMNDFIQSGRVHSIHHEQRVRGRYATCIFFHMMPVDLQWPTLARPRRYLAAKHPVLNSSNACLLCPTMCRSLAGRGCCLRPSSLLPTWQPSFWTGECNTFGDAQPVAPITVKNIADTLLILRVFASWPCGTPWPSYPGENSRNLS